VVYPASGGLADRRGPGFVLGLGLVVTITAFGSMALAAATAPAWKALAAGAALVAAAVAYSFEVAGATMLAARLTPGSEGSAMGLLNSIIAAGAIVGAMVPSFVAEAFGYDWQPLLATGVLVLAVATGTPMMRRGSSPGPPTAVPPPELGPPRAAGGSPGRCLQGCVTGHDPRAAGPGGGAAGCDRAGMLQAALRWEGRLWCGRGAAGPGQAAPPG
jgi:MFS family permease